MADQPPCKITAEQKARSAQLTKRTVDIAAQAEAAAILRQLAAQSTGTHLGAQPQAPAAHDQPVPPPESQALPQLQPSAAALEAAIQEAKQVALRPVEDEQPPPTPMPTLIAPIAPPPPGVTKKHDLIAWYRSQGLTDKEVIDKVNGLHGLKIDQTEVNANKKHYGGPKIPANPSVPASAYGSAAGVTPEPQPAPAPKPEAPTHLPKPEQPAPVPARRPVPPGTAPYTGGKVAKYLGEHYAPEPVSEGDKQAFNLYQGDGNKPINAALRAGEDIATWMGKNGYNESQIAHFTENAERIEQLIAGSAPLDHPVVVYRTVHDVTDVAPTPEISPATKYQYSKRSATPQDVLAAVAAHLPVGEVILDRGFVSTTASTVQADKWLNRMTKASNPAAPGVRYEITLPAGTKAAWAEHFGDKQANFVVQKELLLPPGSRFQVTEVIAPETKVISDYEYNPKTKQYDTTEKLRWLGYTKDNPFIVKMTLVPATNAPAAISPSKLEALVAEHRAAGVTSPDEIAQRIAASHVPVAPAKVAEITAKQLVAEAKAKRGAEQLEANKAFIHAQAIAGQSPYHIYHAVAYGTSWDSKTQTYAKAALAPDVTQEQVAAERAKALATVADVTAAARASLFTHPLAPAPNAYVGGTGAEARMASFKAATEAKLGRTLTDEEAGAAFKRVETVTFPSGATTSAKTLHNLNAEGRDPAQIAKEVGTKLEPVTIADVQQALSDYGLRTKVRSLNEEGPQTTAQKNALLNKTYPAESFTHPARQAIRHYQGPGDAINADLRKNNGVSTYATETVKALDAFFAAAPGIPQPITVYRGIKDTRPIVGTKSISADPLGDATAHFKRLLTTGTPYTDAGYFSMSPNRPFTQKWAGGFGRQGLMFSVKLPAGSKGAWIPKAGTGVYKKEQELLGPRGRAYKVLAVHDAVMDVGGHVTTPLEVDIELLPEGGTP